MLLKVGGDFRINSTLVGDQREVALTSIGNGRFVAAWFGADGGDGSGLGIRARIFGADGQPTGQDFIVNTTGAGDQVDPKVTTLADGRFVIVWGDASNSVRARIYGADGVPAGPDFKVSTSALGADFTPDVAALASGGFVVTWEAFGAGGSPILGQIFNAAGSAVGTEFTVSTTTNSTTSSNGDRPVVTALASGGFAVAWHSFDGGDGAETTIRGRIYGANGAPVGDDFIINSTGAGFQGYPSLDQLPDGRIVAVWNSSDPGDGSGGCIRARIFNPDGTFTGTDFIANTNTPLGQSRPSVLVLADGRIVMAWTDNDTASDGNGLAIRARVFDQNGKAQGADFVVNTVSNDDQFRTEITQMSDGRIVIAWTSEDARFETGRSVRAQIFDPNVFDGSPGNDTLDGTALNDTLNGLAGNDRLNGLAGNDKLFGGVGNDLLIGGLGVDIMVGGAGDDTYVVDHALDTVNETGGTGNDLVTASVTYTLTSARVTGAVERLTLSGTAAINGTGNAFNNIITGNAAANVLSGMNGNDTLLGNAGNDRLLGGVGNDVHNGGLGADIMIGGVGNDVYVVDNIADVVNEAGGSGIDSVTSSVTYSLGAPRVVGAVENLTLIGRALNGTGNAFNNIITGNGFANVLSGLAGNDRLIGGVGNDRLIGGVGVDVLIGGLGVDRFVFTSTLDSRPGAGSDQIVDFIRGQGDKIDLSLIDADIDGTAGNQAFAFIGAAAFSGADGQLRFQAGRLQGDVNGDRVADFEVRISLATMVAGDFIL